MKANELKPKLSFEKRRPYLQDQLLFIPTYYNRHAEFKMPAFESSEIFSKKMPVHVEFCSGNGEWIIEAAKENPEIGWVAVEMKFARIRKIYAKGKTLGLKNLLVVWGRGEDFIEHYLQEESIDRAFVHFPDPWPKQRHAKHRIIQKEFCYGIKRVLCDEGSFHLITDDRTYRDQMIDVVNIDFESQDESLWVTRTLEFSSYFYRLWKSLDRGIFSLNYKKKAQEVIVLDVSSDNCPDCQELISKAKEVVAKGKKIVWIFDFKLAAHELPLFSETLYAGYKLTIEKLNEKVLSLFEDSTSEFRLIDDIFSFEGIPTLSLEGQSAFDAYCKLDNTTRSFRSFYISSLVDFLECLAAYLPLDPVRSIHLDLTSTLTRAEFADLFSLRNFQDIDLRIARAPISTQRLLTSQINTGYENALVIPTTERGDYQKVQSQIESLESESVEFCLIPEEHLIDYWHGIERLYVCQDNLSESVMRALDGFKASLGQIYNV
jgi:tRNA (guanine-N7-)-methyltransferase